MESKREIQEVILANRIYLYTLTHTLFGGEPNKELLEQLATEHTALAWSLLSTEEGDLFEQMSEFTQGLQKKIQEEHFKESVKREYTKLMIGPGRLIAYPWASMYLGKEKMLFLESTVEARRTYKKYGFLPAAYLQVADDHLAIELHFMAKMSERAKEAFEQENLEEMHKVLEGQKDFLKDHLLKWITQYAKDMEKAESALLYAQYAQALEAFLRADLEVLESLVLKK